MLQQLLRQQCPRTVVISQLLTFANGRYNSSARQLLLPLSCSRRFSRQQERAEEKEKKEGSNDQRGRGRSSSAAAAAAPAVAIAVCSSLTPSFSNGDGGGGGGGGALNVDAAEMLRCCREGDELRVGRLLAGGAGVGATAAESRRRRLANARHPLGWTALAAAVANGQVGVVRALLGAGADPDAADEYSGAYATAARLRANSAEIRNLRDAEFCEALNPDASFEGCGPLHYAALTDSEEIARLLLDAGADPSRPNAQGHKPSVYAKDDRMRSLLTSAEKAAERRRRRQFPLEQRLRAGIVGQDAAIRCVAAAIRRKENGWGDSDHPLVFLFLGSSGVGKTELAKQVSQYLNRDPQHGFVRLDMSEYAEKHEAAKLIGAPPGYVGHESGGQLTQALRRCPSATVLLDEVDKAHPDVLSTLLQLFDEGRLTDGKGRTVSCRDAVFIMTSNLAADQIAEYGQRLRAGQRISGGGGGGGGLGSGELEIEAEVSREFKDTVVRPILKRHFRRDEFLGRINEIVYFLPFNTSELGILVCRQLGKWATVAVDRHGVQVTWEPAAVDLLIAGYDCHYGARSLKYEVDRQVVSQLALADELGLLARGDRVRLVVTPGGSGAAAAKIDLEVTGASGGKTMLLSHRLREREGKIEEKAGEGKR